MRDTNFYFAFHMNTSIWFLSKACYLLLNIWRFGCGFVRGGFQKKTKKYFRTSKKTISITANGKKIRVKVCSCFWKSVRAFDKLPALKHAKKRGLLREKSSNLCLNKQNSPIKRKKDWFFINPIVSYVYMTLINTSFYRFLMFFSITSLSPVHFYFIFK